MTRKFVLKRSRIDIPDVDVSAKVEKLESFDNLPVSGAASNFWIIWTPRAFEQVHFKIVFMPHEHLHHSFCKLLNNINRGWVPFATNGRTSQTLKVLSIEFDKTYEPQFESDKDVTVSLCPFMFVQTLTDVRTPSFTAGIIPAWFFCRKSWQHYQFRRKWLDRRCRWTSQMSFGSDTSSRRWIPFFACPKFLLSNRLMLKQQADLLFVQHVRHWRFPGALKRNC